MMDYLKQQWLPACLLSELSTNKPLRRIICDVPIVLYKTPDGSYKGFIDRCPHRGAPLSSGKLINGQLQCPYHGWQFDQDGQCVHIPGLVSKLKPDNKNLTDVNVFPHCDFLFVCFSLTKQTYELYQAPLQYHEDNTYHIWQTSLQGDLLDILANILDVTHTHFIHSGLLTINNRRHTVEAQLKVTDVMAQVTYFEDKRQSGWFSRLFKSHRTKSIVRFHAPLVAELEYHTQKGLKFAITVLLCPTEKNHWHVYTLLTHPKGLIPSFVKKQLFMPFIKRALSQNKHILNLQQRNHHYFDETLNQSTELDLLRPHIERILTNTSKPYGKIIKMTI